MTPDQFRTIRLNASLSLDGLAKVLGISDRSTVHRWEKGISPVSGPVTRLMEMLDCGELPARYLGEKA